MAISDRARALHQDALIIDGLNFYSDGTTDVFRTGNVHAVNLTVAGLLSDYGQVCDELGVWHARLSDPNCEWFLIRETADFDRARKAGITVPIVPGIMPVTNFAQMAKFAATAGASVPRTMAPASGSLGRSRMKDWSIFSLSTAKRRR